MHVLPDTPRTNVVSNDRDEWAAGSARQLGEADRRLWCECINSWVRPFPNRWGLLPDDIKDEQNAIFHTSSLLLKLPETQREGLEPRAAEATAAHSDRADSSDWTEDDAQELEEAGATASKLNREFVRFLVDANIRDRGLTDVAKTTMYAFLDVLGPLRERIKSLECRREHQRMLVRRRERVAYELELVQQRKLEREREFERQRQHQLDAHNVFWRRASRWISRCGIYIGKKCKAPALLEAASVQVEKSSRC